MTDEGPSDKARAPRGEIAVKPGIKRVLKGVVAVIVVGAVGMGIFVKTKTSAYDDSMEKVYAVPLPDVKASTDPAVIARGKHVVEAIGGCAGKGCHGADLAGGAPIVMGPVATLTGSNVTPKGILGLYSDPELARLLRHGLKKDSRSVRFMPVQDFGWLPDSDIAAMVSYLRTVPGVDKPNADMEIKTLGKVIDRKGGIVFDVARRIDHEKLDLAPPPAPTPEYGKYLARLCTGCHGDHLSGGPIPGAPKELPVPLNITPDATGMKDWTYQDFDALMTKGIRKNGKPLDPFMPIESFGKMDDTEKHALYSYLMALAPLPAGGR